MVITPELEAQLREAGWYPGRRAGDEQVDAWLRMGVQDFGCHIFPEAVRVLQEYGGLTLGNLHFSPEGSMARGDRDLWLLWEWQVNEVLFPVASDLGGAFAFALSSTGKVYGEGVSDIFCGNSFEEFLENDLAFKQGRHDWQGNTPLHWTSKMDRELERTYKAVFGQPQAE